MTNEEIKTKGQTYLMNTFNRGAICMVEGQGSYLKDADGKQYLDFLAGIAGRPLPEKRIDYQKTDILSRLHPGVDNRPPAATEYR